jgi:ABC-2 type transport system ATP-binding protein
VSVIRIDRLVKSFGSVRALAGVSFTVDKHETVGFLGPNGAGKTTTLRILCGYLAADGGKVTVDGIDVAERPLDAQRRIGYLPENAPAYGDMRVGDYLAFRARLKRCGRKAVDGAAERARVADVRGRRIGELSKGYRQRVGLADALLGDPPVLVLDEPSAGLDPQQIRDLRELIKELGRERTVILSSHILPEVEASCDRVVILHEGRVAAECRPRDFEAARYTRVRVDRERVEQAETLVGMERRYGDGSFASALPPAEVARLLVGANIPIVEVYPERRRLEDLFIEATAT